MCAQTLKLSLKTAFTTLCLLALNVAGAATEPPETFQSVDGVAIYLGVMPAQIVRGHPPAQQENRMHGGIPEGRNSVHLVVALFDEASGKRIEGAQITAEVSELGLGGKSKKLDTMRIADTITYGNYFVMMSEKNYRIRLSIRLPGGAKPLKASFTHRHFAP